MLPIIASIVSIVLQLFFYLLIARVILDFVAQMRRDWTPKGPMLIFASAVYGVTDPPVKLVQRFVKPIRVGAAAIDPSVFVLQLVVIVLMLFVPALLR